jgi:putative hemolysin
VHDLLRLLAVFALVFGNAFFVIAEYSIITARRSPLQQRDSRGARIALKLMDDPVRVISTVQVGITAIAILTGAVGEPVIRDLLGDDVPRWLGFAIAFIVVTYLSVVIGELAPKALVLDRAEVLAVRVARPVEWMAVALSPVVWVLDRSAGVLLRPFGVKEVIAGEGVRSAEELRAIVDEAEGAGVIPRAQEELLHNVFDFANREVRDVMVAAPDVEWLEASLTPSQALDAAVEGPHERYPVGDGSIDSLVGIVHIQSIIAADRRGGGETLRELARPAPIVPETKDLGALLRELREQREQLAVVVDEYGATAGIVAIEDILEEIVGEIESEYRLPDNSLSWVDEKTVEAVGSMSIDDFNEAVGTTLPMRGPRTLAGLVFDALGRRPRPCDAVSVDGVRLQIEQVDGLRITKLRIAL